MENPVKVLVIDDEEIIRQCSRRSLGPAGYMVDTASSGQEGLELVNKNSYDLVLVDMMMPEMSGAEVVKHIKAVAPESRILVITGYSSADTAEMVRQMGVCYLEKPYSPQTLLKSVELVLKQGEEDCFL